MKNMDNWRAGHHGWMCLVLGAFDFGWDELVHRIAPVGWAPSCALDVTWQLRWWREDNNRWENRSQKVKTQSEVPEWVRGHALYRQAPLIESCLEVIGDNAVERNTYRDGYCSSIYTRQQFSKVRITVGTVYIVFDICSFNNYPTKTQNCNCDNEREHIDCEPPPESQHSNNRLTSHP